MLEEKLSPQPMSYLLSKDKVELPMVSALCDVILHFQNLNG
jgi:hypothetical protein